ncbi:hypothetical protein OH76DRAFT_259921 [Lentinus brumalis]|uniref:Uncharacterized protein n=1 Tax=Lentinus brumalis TaxID=2498619 RepID=A0A371DGG9_9APHY|nr:hypothetical protein OH76DRAFT_259921 [Polyporus brumalis]
MHKNANRGEIINHPVDECLHGFVSRTTCIDTATPPDGSTYQRNISNTSRRCAPVREKPFLAREKHIRALRVVQARVARTLRLQNPRDSSASSSDSLDSSSSSSSGENFGRYSVRSTRGRALPVLHATTTVAAAAFICEQPARVLAAERRLEGRGVSRVAAATTMARDAK